MQLSSSGLEEQAQAGVIFRFSSALYIVVYKVHLLESFGEAVWFFQSDISDISLSIS